MFERFNLPCLMQQQLFLPHCHSTRPALAGLAMLTRCGDSMPPPPPSAGSDHVEDHTHLLPHGGSSTRLSASVERRSAGASFQGRLPSAALDVQNRTNVTVSLAQGNPPPAPAKNPRVILAVHCGLALSGLVLLCGCKPAATPTVDRDPLPGEEVVAQPKVVQIIAHTGDFEVFVEHERAIAGRATPFITHVTDLHSREPRTSGGIQYVLRQGDHVIEPPDSAPEKPGIYLPAITFPKAGDWQGTLLIPADGTNATVDLGTIRVFTDARAALEADLGSPPEGISLRKEQQWKIRIRTERVTRRRLVERLRAAATVLAKPGFQAEVISPMAGQLIAPPSGSLVRLGDSVEAGQTLALVQPAFSEATAKLGETEGEIARARLALAQARRDLDRISRLVEAQAESRQNLELARLSVDSAEAQLKAALATQTSYLKEAGPSGNLPTLALTSPISGIVVSARSLALGQQVGADVPLFTVLDPETVWIEARVPEAQASRISSAEEALAESPGRPGEFVPLTGDGRGRLVFASPRVDPLTHTVRFAYEVPNRDGRFRIGEHLTVFIESGHADNAVTLPDSAIVEEGGQPVAFVQVGGETFQKRELSLGIRDGNQVQVLRGLQAGDRVVTQGAYALRLASLSAVIPAHGHVH